MNWEETLLLRTYFLMRLRGSGAGLGAGLGGDFGRALRRRRFAVGAEAGSVAEQGLDAAKLANELRALRSA